MPKPSDSPSPSPATRRTPAARHGTAEGRASPKSPPGVAGTGDNTAAAPNRKKAEPTLLGDFLLGRPSPARLAAQRAAAAAAAAQNSQQQQTGASRRKSVAAMDAARVREELRQDMRAEAVQKLQRPGGVRDRVKAWQKSNAVAAARVGTAVPTAEDAASEPTEVGVQVDAASVTEEDRVRIKMRRKSRPPRRRSRNSGDEEEEDMIVVEEAEGGEAYDGWTDAEPAQPETKSDEQHFKDARPPEPPKKRIVSDEHWVKRKKSRSPPRAKKKPSAMPKDFAPRTAPNPSVQHKIKDWAARVDVSDSPPTASPRAKHARHKSSGAIFTAEEDRRLDDDDGIRVRPMDVDDEESARGEKKYGAIPKSRVDHGIRVKLTRKKEAPDHGVRVRLSEVSESSYMGRDNAIRVEPLSKKEAHDDGIRVRPSEASESSYMYPDDGIRVRPSEVGDSSYTDGHDGTRVDEPLRKKEAPDDGIRVRPSEVGESSYMYPDDGIRVRPIPEVVIEDVDTDVPGKRHDHSPDTAIHVTEEAETEVDTPTKRAAHKSPWPRRRRSSSSMKRTEVTANAGDTGENSDSDPANTMASTMLGSKSLADIPVGYSAFSVLDLSLGAGARNGAKRPKAQRNVTLKTTVPNVFKKVVSGAKEIIQDRVVDHAKPMVANQPPSIELWLNTTVDPFVEKKPWPKPSESDSPSEEADAQPMADEEKEKEKEKTSATTGLKRSRALRSSSSPIKLGVKTPFREALKQAFRGESGGHKLRPTVYASCEASDHESDADHGAREECEEAPEPERTESRPRAESAGVQSRPRWPSPDACSVSSSSIDSVLTVKEAPARKKPPTKGVHELSTIASEVSSSACWSDTVSNLSQTTLTQSTALTRSTDMSRRKSHKSGVKRRLTKHSDLVSMLSVPDDETMSGRLPPSRSVRSSRSLHRKPSRPYQDKDDGVKELLREFADDEHFYQRELKTLVDGVIPVLLTQVVHGGNEDVQASSVVRMGIALERLKNRHRRAPLASMHQLAAWLDAVHPVYDNYLDVWRLGFQDLVVNLAPAAGKLDDQDSLVGAMPRNEDGDVLGANGQRADVAYLLKRPLVRIKWMTKFLKAASTMLSDQEFADVVIRFEELSEKCRKRHREETARITDEDAINTDTSRCRDLRTLAPLDGVRIDDTRQVAAKDSFSLHLYHSSGQRLECEVELVFRDNPQVAADKGDVLIRDKGSRSRTWLLFPPVPMDKMSARRGDCGLSVVVCIRGFHNGNEWCEVMTLYCDSEDQVADWLDMLGTSPVPPSILPEKPMTSGTMPASNVADVPVGVGKHSTSPPTTSRWTGTPSPDKTPTQESYLSEDEDHDVPPPPPVHRVPMAPRSPAPVLCPPVEHDRVRRRGSSPLKHECHRSDISSDSETSSESDMSDDDTSSDDDDEEDDLDEEDVPDTLPGYSLKGSHMLPAIEWVEEEEEEEEEDSPSQTTLHEKDEGEYETAKFVAHVSYWSNRRGQWKDVGTDAYSVVVGPGMVTVYGQDEVEAGKSKPKPAVALDLTPLVILRLSTALDLEVKSRPLPNSRLGRVDSAIWRFRSASSADAQALYKAVRHGRLHNAKFMRLEEETRMRSFGEGRAGPVRGKSYRASTRAPAPGSQGSGGSGSSGAAMSANTFLRRLRHRGADASFNIERSTVDKPSPRTSSSSSGASLSGAGSSSRWSWGNGGAKPFRPDEGPLVVRAYVGVGSRWSDRGSCVLQVLRPPPGVRQALALDSGLEKRVLLTTLPKRSRDDAPAVVLLDAVLGSNSFGTLGTKGVLCSVWEDLRDEHGRVGWAPRKGGLAGRVSRWCLQCASVPQADFVKHLLRSEVPEVML